MLYMLGGVQIDTRPFSIDSMDRDSSASIAVKAVMGGLQRKENTGEGEDNVTIEGQILPFKLGGLTELEVLQEMRAKGARFPLMRGDGYRFGGKWYVINGIKEKHKELMGNGVGFVVHHTISMEQADFSAGDGQQVISAILSIFDALTGR